MTGFIADIIVNLTLPSLVFLDANGNKITNQDPQFTAFMLLIVKFVYASIVYYIIKTSSASGIRLIAYVYFAIIGLSSIMTQVETLIFLGAFPALTTWQVGQFVLASSISGILFVPFAVLIYGRKKENNFYKDKPTFAVFKIFILSILYVGIYLFFGYFVAYRFDAVVDFYKNRTDLYSTTAFLTIQFIRGTFWVIFIMPLLNSINTYKKKVISSIFMYSLLPTIPLIIPNPVMPSLVRLGHFLEVSSSMALFGFLIAWVMNSEKISDQLSAILKWNKNATKAKI
jgi:hypothetical protein